MIRLRTAVTSYAPLTDAAFHAGGAAVNLAQSLTSAKIGAGSVKHIDK